jgi:hypothetical protein
MARRCGTVRSVFETGRTIPTEALFLEYREASGEILTPELFEKPSTRPVGPRPILRSMRLCAAGSHLQKRARRDACRRHAICRSRAETSGSPTAKNLRRSDALPVLRATVRGTIRAIARTVGDDPC